MAIANDRLGTLAHYIIARSVPDKLGATKLNKILWFADIEFYRRHGRSMSGLTHYVRMPRGPVPHGIDKTILSLKSSGKIFERETRVYSYTRREFVWLQDPDLAQFTAEEIDVLNELIDLICEHTADGISEITHDALWQELRDGELMPIQAGSVISKTPDEKHLEWAIRAVSV